MNTLVDDIGSLPLPHYANERLFNEAYELAREAIINGKNVKEDKFIFNNFYRVIVDSFKKKLAAGLDVVNYPQHYDMHKQFADAIHKAMDKGTYVVDKTQAVIPEVHVINNEARQISEEIGRKISLRICITGPLELYLKEIGTTAYSDVLLMFAESVKNFAKNSVLNSKHVATEVVSLDEPSFGFQDVSAEQDLVLDVLEKAFDFGGAVKQIHLHSSTRVADLLNVKNVDVLSFEYASSPKNIDAVSKAMLERVDKQIRVGIARTDINTMLAELYEKGVAKPTLEQLVESEENIRQRFVKAKAKYGERMSFTGPDCGLGGWSTQESALLLLEKTVNAVKTTKKVQSNL